MGAELRARMIDVLIEFKMRWFQRRIDLVLIAWMLPLGEIMRNWLNIMSLLVNL